MRGPFRKFSQGGHFDRAHRSLNIFVLVGSPVELQFVSLKPDCLASAAVASDVVLLLCTLQSVCVELAVSGSRVARRGLVGELVTDAVHRFLLREHVSVAHFVLPSSSCIYSLAHG